MGNQASVKKICFEDMQHIIKQRNRRYLIINTLLPMEQDCLITSTIPSDKEEAIINSYMRGTKPVVVIYGKNTNDNSILKKYQQLEGLGFPRVYVYPGWDVRVVMSTRYLREGGICNDGSGARYTEVQTALTSSHRSPTT